MKNTVWTKWEKYAYFARSLQSRPFALLWAGQTISALGDGAFTTALAWEVLLQTGSSALMSIVVIAKQVPMLLFLLFGGVAADRLPRRLLMLYSDGGRAFIVLLIACLGWLHSLQFWHIIVLSLLFGFIGSFFNPAYQALPAQLVEVKDMPSVNAMKGLSRQMSVLFGPLVGAGSIALEGPFFAFAFDGLTFIISALCLIAIRVPIVPPYSRQATSDSSSISLISNSKGLWKILKDVREGIDYMASIRWLWISILIGSLLNIGMAAPLIVVFPKLVQRSYGASVWLLGALVTASAIGSIIASFLIGQRQSLHKRGLLAYLSLVISSTSLIVLGLPLPYSIEPIVAIAAEAIFGFGFGTFEVIWETLMQEYVPNDKLGRISSIDMLGSFCLLPLGYALAGILGDRIGPNWVFVVGGLMSSVLAVLALSVRDIRCLD